jgi:M6 family metalloprotease-like protein
MQRKFLGPVSVVSAALATTMLFSGCAPQASQLDSQPELNSEKTSQTGERKYFDDYCDVDPDLSPEWAKYQDIFQSFNWCIGPYRIIPATMTDETPQTAVSARDRLLNVNECRIENDPAADQVRAFPNSNQTWLEQELHPSPHTSYQVIPLTSPDAPNLTGNTPTQDYGKYLEFISEWTKYVTDGKSKVSYSIPDEYIKFPKKIAPFKVGHKNWNDPGHVAFAEEVVKAISGKIDVRNSDMLLIVVPEGTDLGVVEQGPVPITQNGFWHRNATTLSPGLTSENAERQFNLWFSHPMGVLHELYHVGPGLEDHMGDAHDSLAGLSKEDHLGTGQWGLMSSGQTDLLAWEKWYLGFMKSKQVRCAPKTESTTHWLAPSTVKTELEKLLVIPLSRYEAIVVESMRARGLNYKLQQSSEGALVYHLNTSEPRRDYAYRLLSSEDRGLTYLPFRLADWPLKSGESLIFKGVQISILEAGEFGDVIEVRPSN